MNGIDMHQLHMYTWHSGLLVQPQPCHMSVHDMCHVGMVMGVMYGLWCI